MAELTDLVKSKTSENLIKSRQQGYFYSSIDKNISNFFAFFIRLVYNKVIVLLK